MSPTAPTYLRPNPSSVILPEGIAEVSKSARRLLEPSHNSSSPQLAFDRLRVAHGAMTDHRCPGKWHVHSFVMRHFQLAGARGQEGPRRAFKQRNMPPHVDEHGGRRPGSWLPALRPMLCDRSETAPVLDLGLSAWLGLA